MVQLLVSNGAKLYKKKEGGLVELRVSRLSGCTIPLHHAMLWIQSCFIMYAEGRCPSICICLWRLEWCLTPQMLLCLVCICMTTVVPAEHQHLEIVWSAIQNVLPLMHCWWRQVCEDVGR